MVFSNFMPNRKSIYCSLNSTAKGKRKLVVCGLNFIAKGKGKLESPYLDGFWTSSTLFNKTTLKN